MPQIRVIPGNLPVSASCGDEDLGATVVNQSAAAIVYYSDRADVESNIEGTLGPGDQATLFGNQFFWVPKTSALGVVDITPLEGSSPVVVPGGGVCVVVTQEPADGQFPPGTLIVLVDGFQTFVKMWVQL